MPLLRKANTVPKKIELSDEGDYIEVATEITKGDFNKLVEVMPATIDDAEGISPTQGIDLMTDFFKIFVKGWSLDEPPTVEAYLALPKEGADAIDTALMAHFTSLTPSDDERKKSEKSPRTGQKVGTSGTP